MKKKYLGLSLCLLTMLCACTSATNVRDWSAAASTNKSHSKCNDVVKETRNVAKFNAIKATTGIEVEYYPTDATPRIEVSVNKDCRDNLTTNVSGGTLNIGFKGDVHTAETTLVKVYGYKAHTFKATAASSIYIARDLDVADKLNMECSAAATISWKGTLKAHDVKISASSGAEVKGATLSANGIANVDMTSAAECQFQNLMASGNCNVNTTSAAQLNIRNLKAANLNIEASTAAEVAFSSGSVTNLNVNTSTGAEVDVRYVQHHGNIHIEKHTGGTIK